MSKFSLWYGVALNHQDKAAPLLYALRYDQEALLSGRDAVVSAIKERGGSLEYDGGEERFFLGFKGHLTRPREAGLLVEELSIFNEALQMKSILGIPQGSISDHLVRFKTAYCCAVEAGDYLRASGLFREFEKLATDLRDADHENGVLSNPDGILLSALECSLLGKKRPLVSWGTDMIYE